MLLTQGDDNLTAFTGIVDTFNLTMSFLQIPVSKPIIAGGLDAPKDVEKNGSVMDRSYQLGKNRPPCNNNLQSKEFHSFL
ncbi:hypothetical protein [Methanospirillum lacunae]|uniref:hypothetical protein n=1 Tax=Methanospirillum lacunae TaxID=668570 RepID=UPI0011B232D8|nr:hypothetical protein [Methanospirillum lacunae]